MVEGWTWLHTTRSVSGARTRILGAHFPNPHNLLLVTSHAVEYYSVPSLRAHALHFILRILCHDYIENNHELD